MTKFLHSLATGSVLGVHHYGSMYGCARLFRAICSAKVTRLATMRATLRSLTECVHGSSLAGQTGKDYASTKSKIVVKLTPEQRRMYFVSRCNQLLGVWQCCMAVFDYVLEERMVVKHLTSVSVGTGRSSTRRTQVFALRVALMSVEKQLLDLANTVVAQVFKDVSDGSEIDAAFTSTVRERMLEALNENGVRVRIMLMRLMEARRLSVASTARELDQPLDEMMELAGTTEKVSGLPMVPTSASSKDDQRQGLRSAAVEVAHYGLSSSRMTLRGIVDQLVFGYFQLLSDVSPRALSEFLGPDVELVEQYRGRIEMVRDGVLEVVCFPTPLAVRTAVGDVHVEDAVKSLLTSPNISRDFHSNKLRDFVRESATVINIIKYQNLLNTLARKSNSTLLLHSVSAYRIAVFCCC
jgi:hypothetical protein